MDKFVAGKDVAPLFPWWQTGMIDLDEYDLTTPGHQFSFNAGGMTPGQRVEPYLRNDQPGPIAVTEVRFWSNQPFFPYAASDVSDLGDWLDALVVQMETDLLQGLVEEWMPVKALHTVEDSSFYGRCASGYMRLPTPYFVQAQNQFGLKLQLRQDVGAAVGLFSVPAISLRGYDPLTGIPMMRNMLLDAAFDVSGTANYSLDENRDAPLRDFVFQEIAFGTSGGGFDGGDEQYAIFDAFEIKFEPPEGPSWTRDPYTHLYQGLFEQLGVGFVAPEEGRLMQRPVVMHRPKRPYILRPGDTFRVRAKYHGGVTSKNDWAFPTEAYYDAQENPHGRNLLFCRISGVQEGTNA